MRNYLTPLLLLLSSGLIDAVTQPQGNQLTDAQIEAILLTETDELDALLFESETALLDENDPTLTDAEIEALIAETDPFIETEGQALDIMTSLTLASGYNSNITRSPFDKIQSPFVAAGTELELTYFLNSNWSVRADGTYLQRHHTEADSLGDEIEASSQAEISYQWGSNQSISLAGTYHRRCALDAKYLIKKDYCKKAGGF